MDAEERRALVIEGIRTYMKEIGLSENTQALFVLVAENILFPPTPAPFRPGGFPAPFPGAVMHPMMLPQWAIEERGKVKKYLNVATLYSHAVDIAVSKVDPRATDDSLSVAVEDDSGEEWTLHGATAQAFLDHAAALGMFDYDDSPPAEIAAKVKERKKQQADFTAAMALQYGPTSQDMEKTFGAHPDPIDPDNEETIG